MDHSLTSATVLETMVDQVLDPRVEELLLELVLELIMSHTEVVEELLQEARRQVVAIQDLLEITDQTVLQVLELQQEKEVTDLMHLDRKENHIKVLLGDQIPEAIIITDREGHQPEVAVEVITEALHLEVLDLVLDRHLDRALDHRQEEVVDNLY